MDKLTPPPVLDHDFTFVPQIAFSGFCTDFSDDSVVDYVHVYAQLYAGPHMYDTLKPYIELSRSDFKNFRGSFRGIKDLTFTEAWQWLYSDATDRMCLDSSIKSLELVRALRGSEQTFRVISDSQCSQADEQPFHTDSSDSDTSPHRWHKLRRKRKIRREKSVELQCGRISPIRPSRKTNTMENAQCFNVARAIKETPKTVFGPPRISDGERVKTMRERSREQRDEIQRQAALRQAKEQRQAVPKRAREDAIKRARDKRNVALQGGRFIDVSTKVALVGMGALFARFLKKAGDASAAANDIMSSLTDMAVKISKLVGKALWVVPLLLGFYFAIKKQGAVPVGFSVLLAGGLARLVGKDLWDHVSSYFGSSTIELQAGSFQDATSKLLSTIMVFSIFGKKFSHSTVGEFAKRMSALPRLEEGWKVFMDWALSAVESLINYVRKMYGHEAISIYEKRNVLLTQWSSKIDREYVKANTKGFDIDGETLDLYVDLAIEGAAFKDTYRGTPMMRTVEESLTRVINLIKPHQGALCARNNFRVEPEMCVLSGAPGIGKTAMTLPFCFAVMMQSGMVKDYDLDKLINNVWQKGNSEFWNGYARQLCVIMDDAFQARADPTDKDNEFMNIIRMISSWSMPLNFADLESKGKIYFLSQFVLATTNEKSILHDANLCLHEPAAVVRRMGHSYRIELKKEYQNANGFMNWQQFDIECAKVKNNDALDAHPWYMWEAFKQDLATGITDRTPVSLRDIIIEISSSLRMKRASHLSAKDHLSNMVDAFKRADSKLAAVDGDLITIKPDVASSATLESDDDFSSGSWSKVNMEPKLFTDSMEKSSKYANGKCVYPEGLVMEPCFTDEVFDFKYGVHSEYYKPESQVGRLLGFRAHVGAAKRLAKDMAEFKDLTSFVTKWLLGLGIFGALAVATKKISELITGLMKAAFGLIAGFFKFGLDDKTPKPKKGTPRLQSNTPANKPHMRLRATDVRLQSGDPNVARRIYSATYKVVLNLLNGKHSVLGQVMFVNDTLCLQPEHFSHFVRTHRAEGDINDQSTMRFMNATNPSFNFERTVQDYLMFARVTDVERDVEFLRFTNVRAHANVAKNFICEAQLNYMSGQECRLDVCEVDDRTELVAEASRMSYVMRIGLRTTPINFSGRRLNRYFFYDAPTTPGDCGAPLCLLDNTLFSGKTAIGIHVAGDKTKNVGFSAIVTQEMIENARVRLNVIDDRFEEDLATRNIQLQAGFTLPFESGSFLPIGIINKGPHLCPKSSYYKTKLYDCFGTYAYKPSILGPVTRDGVTVYPMANALKPYSTPVYHHDAALLERAAHVALKPLFNCTHLSPRVIFNFDEAVLGVPGMKFRSIPRNTAAGFPYCLDGLPGKKEFFGYGEEYDLTGVKAQELRARVANIIESAKKGIRLSHIFVDFLKDELRSEAKVEAVATRLISSAPMDYTIAFRQYFGAFTVAVMTKNIEAGMAPGICTFTDWTALSNKLQSKGEKVFAGDFKSFDASLQPTLMNVMLDFINKWYNDGEENARVRSVLWLELMHSRHIGGLGRDQVYVYQWNKSLPSGHPFTTVSNSQSSLIYLVACFELCTSDSVGFWSHVYACTMGDDNTNNIDDEVCEKFNQVTVAKAMKTFNLTYTSDVKDGELKPYTDISGITFLKRRFVLEDRHWLCPLEFESFMYTVYWCKNKRLEHDILISVLENALEELSLHEQHVWDKYAARVYEVLSELCITPNLPCSRLAYLNLVRSRADNWY